MIGTHIINDKIKLSDMRLPVWLVFVLLGCSTSKQDRNESILGKWVYATAERLGDYSQNDSASIAEINKSMEGRVLTFYRDSTYTASGRRPGQDSAFFKGHYSMASDGKYLTLDNKDSVRIILTDSVFKFYTPNNGIFVWRKLPSTN